MTHKEVILQIFTGGFLENEVTYEKIEKKLKPLLETLTISKIIMGWSTNKDLYLKTKELLSMYQVKFYLWMPVFSENGLLKPAVTLLDYEGKAVKSYSLKAGENFEFYCPNQQGNVENVIEIYEENFAQIGFDGIFLDKIRYGSFSNGLSGVFNCFCPECRKRYQEHGFDVQSLKKEMKKVALGQNGYEENPLKIISYKQGKYQFSELIWEKYFDEKARYIAEALEKITNYFRKRNMKIGMDTFSPFMGYFTGQDFNRLKTLTDFVKPMMYRVTKSPAGLPFEYYNFIKETTKGNFEHNSSGFNKIIHSSGCVNEKFDIDFIIAELNYITSLNIPIYCGIEINRIDDIAPVYPEYIRENLEYLEETQVNGYVLSWDLLSAPEENIQEVIRYFK